MNHKTCNKCGVTFPATPEYFFRGRRYKYGVKAVCKKCTVDTNRQWRIDNQEKYRAQASRRAREYRKKNPEKMKALAKRQYAKNKDKSK